MRSTLLRYLTLLACIFSLHTANARQTKAKAFIDCKNDCPQMIKIPAGKFMMGSAEAEIGRVKTEGPQHAVTIGKAFAMSVYPITRDEFATFVVDSKYADAGVCKTMEAGKWTDKQGWNWRNPGYDQNGKEPVACASFNDAQAYAEWLSKKTGKHYRLPTEAEWEYAARAGTTTPYWWGTQASHEYANYGAEKCCDPLKQGRDQWDYTSPAGAMRANAFGLYDMGGNIFQWTEDCWNDSFVGAPADGSAWKTGNCNEPVQRGSSWHASADFIRVAYRVHFDRADRNIYMGFRIARDL